MIDKLLMSELIRDRISYKIASMIYTDIHMPLLRFSTRKSVQNVRIQSNYTIDYPSMHWDATRTAANPNSSWTSFALNDILHKSIEISDTL